MITSILTQRPDLIVLLETGKAWQAALEALRSEYPYIIRPDGDCEHYSLMLLSRLPWKTAEVCQIEASGTPVVCARYNLDGRALTILGTHPPPPLSAPEAHARGLQLAALARFAADRPGALLVCGDLNCTSWAPDFQDLLARSGLKDSRIGFGLQASWPASLPGLLRIPIDHMLVSPGILIHRRFLGPNVGSDHRPVILDFELVQ